MLASAVYLLVIAASGVGLTYAMSDRLRPEERLAIGPVVGVVATSVVTFLAFEVVGMGWAAVMVGVGVPAVGAAAAVRRDAARLRRDSRSLRRRIGLPIADGRSLRPFTIVTVLAAAVATRILSLSYQRTPDGVSAGSLAIWGDWSAHLAYAGSFAYGDNRALELPIAAGEGFRYHFLVDFFGSLFTVTGATLEQSMALSAWLLAICVAPLLWLLVLRLTRSRLTAALTMLMFTLSGGVGLWYFAVDVDRDGWHIATELPQTYARMPDQHLWVDNTISASLYAQRSTLLGVGIGLATAILLLASRPSWSRRGFLVAGALIGVTGIAHAHMLLTGLALGGLAAVMDRRREWLWYLVPATVIGLPLAWSIRPQRNSMRWLLGWMAEQSDQPWPVFWLRNVGLLLPLFALLTLFGGAPPRLRRLTAPLWLWFIVPNVVAFHPSEWNNTKYFLFWQLAGCLLIASWLARAFERRADRRPAVARAGLQLAAMLCAVLMVSAGGLDTLRAMQRSSAIPWVPSDDIAGAAWVREHTPTDAVFVYGAHNTSAVAALGGRVAVSGYTGWTYDLGLPDWGTRASASLTILAGAPGTDTQVERYGVDYVVIGPVERQYKGASDAYWDEHGRLVFSRGDVRIYRVANS